MKHGEFFRKYPVFTGDELAGYLSSHGVVGGRAKEALLACHHKTGRIVSGTARVAYSHPGISRPRFLSG